MLYFENIVAKEQIAYNEIFLLSLKSFHLYQKNKLHLKRVSILFHLSAADVLNVRNGLLLSLFQGTFQTSTGTTFATTL